VAHVDSIRFCPICGAELTPPDSLERKTDNVGETDCPRCGAECRVSVLLPDMRPAFEGRGSSG